MQIINDVSEAVVHVELALLFETIVIGVVD